MALARQADGMLLDWLRHCSLEEMLTDELAFGLKTASPLQRALCRLSEGRALGSLSKNQTVERAIGPSSHVGAPRELAIVSGIRTGKSLFAAALAVFWALRCDVSRLGPGEIPRVSIVSLKRDLAAVVFGHLAGRLQASPLLRTCIRSVTSDTVTLIHPTGRDVEIAVVAGARAGGSLVGRWAAGVVFDEFARMLGSESEGVVNWGESRRVVLERLLPGAQIVHISSPWAPYGPAYDLVQSHWGRPTDRMVVVKAPAYDLNPEYWTPERVEAAKADPDVYRTDVLADFASADEAFLSADALSKCEREEGAQPWLAHLTYSAAMDPAVRGNGWTLGIFTRTGDQRIMVGAWEWVGSKTEPLRPRDVLSDIAVICKQYKVRSIDSDQWSYDALADIAEGYGIGLVPWHFTQEQRTEKYLRMRTLMLEGKVSLPSHPTLRTDLLRIRRKVTVSGMRIELPTSSDGRHCDFAPTVMLGLHRYLDDANPSVYETKEARELRQIDEQLEKWGDPQEEAW